MPGYGDARLSAVCLLSKPFDQQQCSNASQALLFFFSTPRPGTYTNINGKTQRILKRPYDVV